MGIRIEVHMPRLGHDMESGMVEAWLKSVGDEVSRGEVIAAIQTDKSTVEMEALADGVLVEIVVEPGVEAPVGAVIAFIEGRP